MKGPNWRLRQQLRIFPQTLTPALMRELLKQAPPTYEQVLFWLARWNLDRTVYRFMGDNPCVSFGAELIIEEQLLRRAYEALALRLYNAIGTGSGQYDSPTKGEYRLFTRSNHGITVPVVVAFIKDMLEPLAMVHSPKLEYAQNTLKAYYNYKVQR